MGKEKSLFVTIGSILIAKFGVLLLPTFSLVALSLIDYATGLMATESRKESVSSAKSIKGIKKKVCMWLLVVVCAFFDILISYAGEYVGIKISFHFIISIAVALWLCFNEIISILENMIDIGITIPKFLLPLAKKIMKKVEEKVEEELNNEN